ncbi:RNA polymerase sigma factor [Desulfofundulus australicus DSM 11792]|jgi:RNA polymerase sigma factor|uniref:RNA polymerase sigma factor SigI n=1 Tax=Desulfofundulus australicus DSM 11792 TaxID=1121425 RepID=A0A1M5AXB5_9FIRM|nr:RNA polymerase sigma factor [Desulfofundulus australicus DSM 11792]
MVLPVGNIENLLALARAGDGTAREQLLAECRPFITRVTAGLCRRHLEWGYDDELSIAFMAFNEAIDRYEEDRKVPFLAYARLLIKSRLTDYLRKENRVSAHMAGSLNSELEEMSAFSLESSRAWGEYLDREAAREREEEIREYAAMLAEFGISFSDLVRCAPRHRDARQVLLHVSRRLAGDGALFEQLVRTGKLPIKELSLLTGVHRKTLERGRKYIIAMALLWHHCQEYLYLCHYLKASGKGE